MIDSTDQDTNTTALVVVTAHKAGSTYQRVDNVSVETTCKLQRWCFRDNSQSNNDGSLNDVIQFLSHLWSKHYWLACQCNGSQDDVPLLFVRRSLVGKYSLVRMPGRGAHSTSCRFYEPRETNSATIGTVANRALLEKGESYSRLTKMFFQTACKAQLNCCHATGDKEYRRLTDKYRLLRTCLMRQMKSMGFQDGTPIITHAAGLLKLRDRQREKDSGCPRYNQSLALLCADEISRSHVYFHSRDQGGISILRIHVRNGVSRIPTPEDSDNGPYLVLLSIPTVEGGHSELVAANAVSVSIHSKRVLMPVSGPAGRTTLNRLLGIQDWLQRKHGLSASVTCRFLDAQNSDEAVSFTISIANGASIRIDPIMLSPGERIHRPSVSSDAPNSVYFYLRLNSEGVYSAVGDKAFGRLITAKLLSGVAAQKHTIKPTDADKEPRYG